MEYKYLEYILKIALYIYMIFFIYFILKYNYQKRRKLSVKCKIFISILFMIYSIISTVHPYVMDKKIYALKFSSDIYLSQVRTESLGLWIVENILHFFTYNPDVLFSLFSFSFTYLILTAYNKDDEATPITLLILLVSEYFIFCFYQLKQCIATAMITLSLLNYFKGNKTGFIICSIIGIIFHETALIIIPIIILLKGTKNKIIRIMEYIAFILCIVFFNQITSTLIKLILTLIPSLSIQLSPYIKNKTIINSINFMTILKGLPFYIISIIGIINRKKLKNIKNYDKYLILSVINCITIICSAYMYWMFRLGIYLQFFSAKLATILYENIKNKKLFLVFIIGIFLILTIKLWIQYYFKYGGI